MMTISDLFDLSKTIAAAVFTEKTYPWEILGELSDFIIMLGKSLPSEEYDQIGDDIWIAKDAKVAPSASVNGPCIIDHDAEIRHCAFIRGSALVGKNSVVGNSTELKNVLLFDYVEVPHYNYVGDSVLGYRAHMGAGSITSNIKSDRTNIVVHADDGNLETGRRKIGAILGDGAEIGCNSVLNPGSVIGAHTTVYPLSNVRGVIPGNCIYKSENCIVPKKEL